MDHRFGISGVGCLVAGVLLAGTMASAAGKPSFTGHWLLNTEESDDPMEKMREALPGGPGGMGGGGGPMGGGMGGRGGMRRPGGGEGRPEGERPETLRDREARLAEIDISHDEPVVRVTDARGKSTSVYTDGRVTSLSENGGDPTAKAKWNDGRLVVTITDGGGRKITETYERSESGARLTVAVKLQAPFGEVKFKRVYDLVEPGTDKEGAKPKP